MIQEYVVSGMSCDTCVQNVTRELSGLGGVTAVDIVLATGKVTVTSDRDLDRGEVARAVDEAGYDLVEA